jgi:hypothetical protein
MERMHVLTLEVFNKLGLQHLRVGHLADTYRDGFALSDHGAAIAPRAENDLEAPLVDRPHKQRLQDAVSADTLGEFLHGIFGKGLSRISGGLDQPIDRQVAIIRLDLHCGRHRNAPWG